MPRGLAILHPNPHDTTVARPIRGACVDGVHGRAGIAGDRAAFATIRPARRFVVSCNYWPGVHPQACIRLIDCEEDRTLQAVLVGMLREDV